MKTCFINSNAIVNIIGKSAVDFDVGLLSIAAILEKNRHSVEIIDLAWLIRQGKLSVDNDFHANAARLITKHGSDVLGFNTRCDTYPFVLNIAKRCKEINPKATIILGGPQATFTDIDTLKAFPCVDIIVRGEGELTIVELIKRLEGKQDLKDISGISYKQNGRIIRNRDRELIEDLDTLPLPAYHLMEKYLSCEDKLSLRDLRIYIQVGRGCPYRCTFCSVTMLWKNRYRLRQQKNILDEIIFLNRRYKIKKFYFGHEHLLYNRKEVIKICAALLRKKIVIEWECASRIDSVDSELLSMLSKSGCRKIHFGIESGSLRIQKDIQKNINPLAVLKVLKECAKYGISTILSFIIGFPEEKRKDINATLELALRCRQFKGCNPCVRLLGLMPGTALFLKDKNRLTITDFWYNLAGNLPIVKLRDNEKLIKKYPSIFSVFYAVKPKYVPIRLPYETVGVFLRLMYTYPLSFYAAMKELRSPPIELLQGFKKWAKKRMPRQSKKKTVLSGLENARSFPVFLRGIYMKRRVSSEFLDCIIEIENKNFKKYYDSLKGYNEPCF